MIHRWLHVPQGYQQEGEGLYHRSSEWLVKVRSVSAAGSLGRGHTGSVQKRQTWGPNQFNSINFPTFLPLPMNVNVHAYTPQNVFIFNEIQSEQWRRQLYFNRGMRS